MSLEIIIQWSSTATLTVVWSPLLIKNIPCGCSFLRRMVISLAYIEWGEEENSSLYWISNKTDMHVHVYIKTSCKQAYQDISKYLPAYPVLVGQLRRHLYKASNGWFLTDQCMVCMSRCLKLQKIEALPFTLYMKKNKQNAQQVTCMHITSERK